jgi:hypothetical protein
LGQGYDPRIFPTSILDVRALRFSTLFGARHEILGRGIEEKRDGVARIGNFCSRFGRKWVNDI